MGVDERDLARRPHSNHRHLRDWFKLDNAAILFPTVAMGNTTTLFRISLCLDRPVNLSRLQEALNRIYRRFPYYNVELHAGIFWYYFELLPEAPKVMADSKYPCMSIHLRSRGRHLFRVRAYDHRIAVEFSHIITDGTGALVFLKSLVAEYLRVSGCGVPAMDGIFMHGERIDPEEFEDSFRRYGDKSLPGPPREHRAFHVPCTNLDKGAYRVTAGIIPIAGVLERTRSFHVSVTEFLAAVYIAALQDIYEELDPIEQLNRGRFIKLMVPVNLRKLFPSRTMRNFSLYILPGIDCRMGHYEFEEILACIHHAMRLQNTAKQLSQQVARNLRGAVAPAIRLIPLFLKKFGGRMLYKKMGEDLYSGCISNLGAVSMPPEMAAHVTRCDFIPAPARLTRTNCAVVSCGDYLYVNFGSLIREREVERRFFTRLIRMGLPVRIETNE